VTGRFVRLATSVLMTSSTSSGVEVERWVAKSSALIASRPRSAVSVSARNRLSLETTIDASPARAAAITCRRSG
jgi:hypothetical protein